MGKPTIILHIDDDTDDLELVKEAFTEIDPSLVLWQSNKGEDALVLLQQSKESGNLPAMIILDMNMPPLNGKDILLEIRNIPEFAAIPVTLFTTSTSVNDKEFAHREGIRFITKPSRQAELIERLKSTLPGYIDSSLRGKLP
ncbi:MAG TPA: response regulator [Flavisolibacter sp.]|jgi:CheY-like chemotaxis protein|nr:response regulator [Flavisolibacter sp.]